MLELLLSFVGFLGFFGVGFLGFPQQLKPLGSGALPRSASEWSGPGSGEVPGVAVEDATCVVSLWLEVCETFQSTVYVQLGKPLNFRGR